MIGMPRDRARSNVDFLDHAMFVVMLLGGGEETHLVLGFLVCVCV